MAVRVVAQVGVGGSVPEAAQLVVAGQPVRPGRRRPAQLERHDHPARLFDAPVVERTVVERGVHLVNAALEVHVASEPDPRPSAPEREGKHVEAAVGRQAVGMGVDGHVLEVAVEQRKGEVRARVGATGHEIEAVVKERLLQGEEHDPRVGRPAAAVVFLHLEEVADLVRGQVAADAVDDEEMQLQAVEAGEALEVHVQSEVDLVRVAHALLQPADGIGGGFGVVGQREVEAVIVQPDAPASPVAGQRAGVGAHGRGTDGRGGHVGGPGGGGSRHGPREPNEEPAPSPATHETKPPEPTHAPWIRAMAGILQSRCAVERHVRRKCCRAGHCKLGPRRDQQFSSRRTRPMKSSSFHPASMPRS